MVELTNNWLDNVTGEHSFCYPGIWIPELYINRAKEFCRHLRSCGAKKIIALNFGVGGNKRKALSSTLEEKLLLTLLEEQDTVILLDKGFGDEERAYINRLIRSVQEKGHRAAHVLIESGTLENIRHGLVGIESSIGEMAALIGCCNEFIGYDSACQHISAALAIPCITIFAGSNNMRFIRRWSAHGQRGCNIVHIDTLNNPALIDINDIISRIMLLRGIHNACPQQ